MINSTYNFGVCIEDHSLLMGHPKGELTADLMYGITNCRDCIQEPGAPRFNRFHNFTNIWSINLGYEEISQISAEKSKMRDVNRFSGAKPKIEGPNVIHIN